MGKSTNFIYNKRPSFASKLFSLFLHIFGIKGIIEGKMKKGRFSQKPAAIHSSLKKNYEIDVSHINGCTVWTLRPRKKVSDKVTIYFHGGAYILNITKYHWQLIEKLLEETGATFIVPDYPLAPNATYEDTFRLADAIYSDILLHTVSESVILMGDSAGAGFILGYAQDLRLHNRPMPSQLILLSPWLDISLSNPDIIKLDKMDKVLGIKGLIWAGKSFAGPLEAKHYKVSPIYGTFSGLGKISVFIGTHDILLPDTRKLKHLLDTEGISMNYFEYTGMFHDWMIFTILPESTMAIKQIALIINEEN